MHQKHIPMRTCAGCGTKASNRELIRIVLTPARSVLVDTTGKQAGRGTFLCQRLSCWEAGIRKGRVAHTLRQPIQPPEREALLAYAYQHYQTPAVPQERNG